MEALLICIGTVVVLVLVVVARIRWKRLEEWKQEHWRECYCCGKVGVVAGWRPLNTPSHSKSFYSAAAACASCRQIRELAREGVSMTAFADMTVCGHCQSLLRRVATSIAKGATKADWPIRKVTFYDSPGAAKNLAERMNDDVRIYGLRMTDY